MFNILILLVLIGSAVLYERSIAARKIHRAPSDHFDGEQFFNPDIRAKISPDQNTKKSIWVWMLFRRRGAWARRAITPIVPPHRVTTGIRVTYINHATVLIQYGGMNIITDPVFAYRASPFSFIGPARHADPGVRLNDLPKINIVLLSHNHYDHMDLASLRVIARRDNPRIYTGLGNAAFLARKGITGAHDMDWWDSIHDGQLKIVAVPAQHFSARSFFDRNLTLWCGFVVETPEGNIYFAGDTGYGSFVQQIAARYESFALGLIPIGAYEPSWMMRPVHMDPDEALRTHRELRIQTSIGIHHGTFRLTDEPMAEPRERIERDRGESDVRVLENGEMFTRP